MGLYRSVLEVLKFLEQKEVLLETSSVNTVWRRAYDTEELWMCFCEDRGYQWDSHSAKDSFKTASRSKSHLVKIEADSLRVYNCSTTSWLMNVRLETSVLIDRSSAIAILSNGRFFLCGGWTSQEGHGAYQLSEDGTVMNLQPLLFPRRYHGITEVGGAIYVFGGMTVDTCEKLELLPSDSLATRTWRRLPDMSEHRYYFNPCVRGQYIYLPCIKNADNSIEKFDTVSCAYSRVTTLSGHNMSVSTSFIHHGDLVVLATTSITRWNFEKETREEAEIAGVFTCGIMNPVVVSDKVFNLEPVSGMIYCFDLVTQRSVAVPNNKCKDFP